MQCRLYSRAYILCTSKPDCDNTNVFCALVTLSNLSHHIKMNSWIVVHAYDQLFIHSVIFIEGVVTIPSGHMTSIHLSILERGPPLLLS